MAEYSEEENGDGVTMPGGEKCEGGVCKKVSKFLRAKVPTKRRYDLGKATPKKADISTTPTKKTGSMPSIN